MLKSQRKVELEYTKKGRRGPRRHKGAGKYWWTKLAILTAALK